MVLEKELEHISVLVVEDDIDLLTMLDVFFRSHGANVSTVNSGQGVIARIGDFCPDILILDVILPYMDGYSIVETLRKQSDQTPIILLTDKQSLDEKIMGLNFGADDYMTKPFSTKELLARVKSVLRRSGEKKPLEKEIISLGKLQIFPYSREARHQDGQRVKLTKTEFDLVCFLTMRKRQVVPRELLLDEVLGYKSDTETKALVMHIANLRKKMVQAGLDNVRIDTVVGIGYKLTDGR
jgi:DNA-binding response OmpR family regulator